MDAKELIDKRIAESDDWRGDLQTEIRKLIHAAAPDIREEWKWNTAVFTHHGLVCALSAFKDHVKINFFKGADLPDPHKIINSGFTSKQHRAIDFYEGDKINEAALKKLVQNAVAYNQSR